MSAVKVPAGVVIDSDVAAGLAVCEQVIRAFWRQQGVAIPVELDAALLVIREVARARVPIGTASGTAAIPEIAPGSTAPRPSRLSTAEVAKRLEISERAVRALLHRDRLDGVQLVDGGPWLVDEGSVSAYEANRKRRAKETAPHAQEDPGDAA